MFNRRDFFKITSALAGNLLLEACKPFPIIATASQPALSPGTPQLTIPASNSPSSLAAGLPAFPRPGLILFNGNFITMDAKETTAQAVAILGDRILATGSSADMRQMADTSTRVIDLHGRTVTPGLIDAHNHLQAWGSMLKHYLALVPPAVSDLVGLLRKLEQAISRTPPGEWVMGYFWEIDTLPTRRVLDPISPDHPVWLIQQGGHYGCCNTCALKIAGISSRTQDPQGGIIQRDARGEPTGLFYNHRAMDLVRRFAPRPTRKEIFTGLPSSEQKMLEAGVTTIHDCNIRMEPLQAYLQAGKDKAMKLRTQLFYTLEWPSDLKHALQGFANPAGGAMRLAGYKFLIDGQFPTWYTHQPHPGIRWNMPTWDPRQFKNAVRLLHDTGLQVAVHCCGDAAVDLVLEAYEEAMEANARPDPRHRLEHAMLCSQDAVRKARDLGVVISCQPQFLQLFKEPVRALGERRAARLIVAREWLESGIPLALGSDTPTVPWYKPQMTLHGAVQRKDARGRAFHPEQNLSLSEALRLHTMGSAYAAFEEKLKGSLEPGKLADLAVWSDNPFSLSPDELLHTGFEMTIIGGEIAYQK